MHMHIISMQSTEKLVATAIPAPSELTLGWVASSSFAMSSLQYSTAVAKAVYVNEHARPACACACACACVRMCIRTCMCGASLDTTQIHPATTVPLLLATVRLDLRRRYAPVQADCLRLPAVTQQRRHRGVEHRRVLPHLRCACAHAYNNRPNHPQPPQPPPQLPITTVTTPPPPHRYATRRTFQSLKSSSSAITRGHSPGLGLGLGLVT